MRKRIGLAALALVIAALVWAAVDGGEEPVRLIDERVNPPTLNDPLPPPPDEDGR